VLPGLRLESSGDPADKRIKIVKVTRQGEAHCKAARDIIVRMENKMLAGMTEEDIDTLWTLLCTAFNNMT
jgi:DNA-binding MarR family transcriptional regulator